MICKMTKYSFILLKGEKDKFLDQVQRIGLVDITRASKPMDDRSAAILAKAEARKRLIPEARAAVDELDVRLARAIKKEAQLKVWGDFDPEDIKRIEELGYTFHFHECDQDKFDDSWKDLCPVKVIRRFNGSVFFVTVIPDGEKDPLEAYKMEAPEYSHETAAGIIREITRERDDAVVRYLDLLGREDVIEESYRSEMADLDLYLASQAAVPAAENTIETMVGYAPTENDAEVSAALDATGVFYIKEAATVEDNPPIELSNNRFTAMFRVLTDMYGRPAYDGFDPTPFLAVFFMLFFAMCMGDAGYGLVIVGIGLFLARSKKAEDYAPLVVTLGVATFVVGFLFHTFFSIDFIDWEALPGWLRSCMVPSKIAGYDGTMVLALVVGVVHLCLAKIVKTYYSVVNKGFLGSLATWGWTLLIVGGVIVGTLMLAGVLSTAAAKITIIVIGIVSAIGIFLLNDIGRNPFINIGSGLWDTYNVATGLIGDVLSYLRLYALGLAGAMLGLAFNNLAGMMLGDGGIMWVPYILILIIGHSLNIAMCILGAFVHPLRLNFLEFFKNSGYEGTGHKFNPLER